MVGKFTSLGRGLRWTVSVTVLECPDAKWELDAPDSLNW